MRSARRLHAAVLLLACACAVHAQSVRLLVQSTTLAGYRYHEAPALRHMLLVGDRLELVREAGNAHDPLAIRVEWRGRMLGYVPRKENDALAHAMDRGEALSARISRLETGRRGFQRVEFEVYVE